MKAIAWILVALVQVALVKFNCLDFFQPVANFFYDHAVSMIESHPSRWNWFYEAILVGRDEGLRQRSTLQAFFTLGLYHLIVVSGSHVVALERIIGTIAFFLPKRVQNVLTVTALLIFSLVNRLQASCVRALVAWLLARRKTLNPTHNADLQMAVTCLCLVFEPQWAQSLSFQLSCGATLGLAIAGTLHFNKPWKRRLGSTFLCTLTTGPLIYCVQACLSWIIIPANTLGMPLFEGILMPISLLNVFFRPISFLTEPVFDFVFGVSDYAATFDHPLLCLDERRLQAWGLVYIAALYFFWRFVWPSCLRKKFAMSQSLMKAA